MLKYLKILHIFWLKTNKHVLICLVGKDSRGIMKASSSQQNACSPQQHVYVADRILAKRAAVIKGSSFPSLNGIKKVVGSPHICDYIPRKDWTATKRARKALVLLRLKRTNQNSPTPSPGRKSYPRDLGEWIENLRPQPTRQPPR